MRRAWILSSVVLLGCPLVTKFDHYDTNLTTDGGTSPVSLALDAAALHIRADESAHFTATITRAETSIGASLTVTDLPPGVIADPARIEAGETSAPITIHFSAPGDASATPLLGKTFHSTIVATLDGESSQNAAAPFTLEVWGKTGTIDALRTTNVAMDKTVLYNGLGTSPVMNQIATRIASFVGSDLAITTTSQILQLTPGSEPIKTPLSVPGSTVVFSAALSGYDGGINVAATGAPLSGSFVTALTSGALGGLTTSKSVALGSICLAAADGKRIICRGPGTNTMSMALYAADSGVISGTPLVVLPNVQITTLLGTPRGWLLAGASLDANGTAQKGLFLSLVDAKGAPVPGFTFTPGNTPNALFVDAMSTGDDFLLTGYENTGSGPLMFVRRYLPTGAVDTKFGTSGTVADFTPACLTGILLSDTPDGVLLSGRQSTGETVIKRLAADTGVIDASFGTGGTVRIPGTLDPIAVAWQSSRIGVGSITSSGAQVNFLYP